MRDWHVMCGDARKLDLPDGSVQCIVTSIPYWNLRAYSDDENEIGREDTLQQWLDNLVTCAREWRRILRDDGTFFLNVGDSFASSSTSPRPSNPGLTGNHSLNPERIPPSNGLKPKDLMMLPARLALALQADGWYLRSSICWIKGLDWLGAERQAQEDIRGALALVREHAEGSLWGLSNGLERALRKAEKAVDRLVMSGAVMPESVSDRPTSAYEMVFLFSKEKRYFYDADAIRIGHSPASLERYKYSWHGNDSGFSADACTGSSYQKMRAGAKMSEMVNPSGRNARNAWRIPVRGAPAGGYQLPDGRVVSHFAAFPVALAARCIRAGTSEAGACGKCGAAFVRMTKPTPEYAKLLGNDWADYEQDTAEGRGHSVSPQRPTKRGKTATASYETVAWHPTCRCYGDPVPADVMCPKCGGTGREMGPGITCPGDKAAHQARRPREENVKLDATIKLHTQYPPKPTGRPCPACLCPDCGGTGIEHVKNNRRTPDELLNAGHSNSYGKVPGSDTRGMPTADWLGTKTGNPCPTCNGIGATGRTNGEIWPDEVLAAWPRKPCVVLDPMAGSGTTGRAALGLGRSVILNDLSPEYVDLCKARMEAWPDDLGGPKKEREIAELPLFAMTAST